jgi:hypothetical protein
MQTEKNLVEEALIQMKQIEDVLTENAKGILASTMKQEIEELVKESLNEQENDFETDEFDNEDNEEYVNIDSTMNSDEFGDESDEFGDESDEDYDVDSEMGDEMGSMMNSDYDDTIDMRMKPKSELLKVFKELPPDSEIIVSKDGDYISLTDEESDSEYLIKLGEQNNKFNMEEDKQYSRMFKHLHNQMDSGDDDLEDDYTKSTYGDDELNYDMKGYEEEDEDNDELEDSDHMYDEMVEEEDELYEEEEDELYEEEEDELYEEEDENKTQDSISRIFAEQKNKSNGIIYEIEIDEDYDLTEAKKTAKFKYSMPKKGFNEKMKEGPKKTGTGKAKFDYDKSAANVDGKMKKVTTSKKEETKEASRTYAMGSKAGRGLRKGVTPNRNLTLENEVISLKQKNNDYKKSLNIFREKLNEVAVFNANLAYATRLFTEHSTTKKEKINILRRFDNIQSLQESKQLFKTINEELSKGVEPSLNEAVGRKISNTASTGSSSNLIESKTYENPQFLRMKDLMGKIG